jgi:hypothetical protein
MTTCVKKAVALYDFRGNPGSDELSFNSGDIITILNADADDGWWEGQLDDGTVGVFPELYVQEFSLTDPVCLLFGFGTCEALRL